MRTYTARFLIAFALLGPLAAAAQERRLLSVVDSIELPTLQDPQLSPDGRTILFVMDAPDWAANRRVGHIYRIAADGSGQVQLTFGERGESSPRWSPDGRRIAFLARRGDDASTQIYVLDADGGEARRITAHPSATKDITWAPDGRLVFFTAPDAKGDEAREKIRLQDDVYAFEETNFDQEHLWVTDLEGKRTQITFGDYSVRSYALSPGGSRITLTRAPSPLLEHLRHSEAWVMDVNGGNARRLTTNQVAEDSPLLSPDGGQVLFTSDANSEFEPYYNDKLFVMPSAGGAARVLLPDAAFQVTAAKWAPDGNSIVFLANHGVHTQLMRVDVATHRITPLTSGSHTVGAWRANDRAGAHVFTLNTPHRPAEIYLLPASGEMRRVTHVFDFVEERYLVARQERLRWKGQDGESVEGLLYYPVNYEAGRRYPLLVFTHGGPASSDTFGFSPEAQVYAGKGYAVLRPNYRGSTGYGDAFLRDMVNGYFKQAHLDVLAGADAVVAMGLADPDKLVKKGWSAGGHMTNRIVTFTDRFKAASSGAGAANWISMYAQSDHRAFRTPWFGGTPWQADAPIELYWEHSPLRHVANVKTPTLFLVGQDDPRVPMPQSVEMYRALKYNGVPTRLWVAPREGHGWAELRHVLFRLQVELEWFDKWLYARPYGWESAPPVTVPGKPKPVTAQP
jgi:dipeptidyl aminopeptidase/acylaminoacyl peptidase